MTITTAKRRSGGLPPQIALSVPLALLAVVLSAPARAQIRVQPAIDVRETYSDNVGLQPDESAHGQLITDVTPSIALTSNSRRLKLNANLAAHLYAYSGERQANTSSSSIQASLNGRLTGVEDLLYVDASASRSRQAISAFGQQTQNGYSTANQDDVSTWRISPYLVRHYGFGDGELRYTHDQVSSGGNLLNNSTGDSLQFRLGSGATYSKFGYDALAYHQDLDSGQAGKSATDNASLTLRYRLLPTFSPYIRASYDRYTYDGLGGSNAGKGYAAGFTWRPSARTSVDASAGRRYFGKTYSLDLTQRSRRTVMRANYSDDITTSRGQFLQSNTIDTASLLDATFAAAFPDPVARQQAIDAYIRANGLPTSVVNNVNYFSNRLLLQRSLNASIAVNGARSTAIISVNNTKRNALSTADADGSLATPALPNLNDDVRQRTVTAALSYRLSSRSAATLQASTSRSQSPGVNVTQEQNLLSFNLSHRFQSKLTGNVELRHNQGKTLSQDGRTYKENAISASLSYKL